MQIKTENELKKVAEDLVAKIRPDLGRSPIIVAMSGPLGAGKTTLTKLILKELRIEQTVVSPTYVLHIPYEGDEFVVDHLDVYRLETEDEFERLKIGELIDKKHLILIEWADKFRGQINNFAKDKTRVIWIEIEYGEDDDSRLIRLWI